ncbi:MAG: hypothetical protein VZT48_08235 [Bulleidia sp.]|nr:hypothetical protein [Bulleidia sp.]
MVSKLTNNLVLRAESRLCIHNEFAVLSSKGDIGFEEYISRKAEACRLAKHLYYPHKEAVLMLRYPDPFNPDKISQADYQMAISLFMDSPYEVSRLHDYEGVFAIDLSA